MRLLRELHVYRETVPHSAAVNMAIDEALLEFSTAPALRLYQWARPSLSFGYFGAFADLGPESRERDVVRRWTGGGIVLHGEDQTYSVILPRRSGEAQPRAQIIYAAIHDAIRRALSPSLHVELAHNNAPRISAACFANPVVADLLVDGKKIAGAAQRRTRQGLLHQGSIQLDSWPAEFAQAFAFALCPNAEMRTPPPAVLARAEVLAQEKYATDKWLRQR